MVKAVGLDEEPCALKYINSCIRNYYEDVKEEWIGRKQELEKMIDGIQAVVMDFQYGIL